TAGDAPGSLYSAPRAHLEDRTVGREHADLPAHAKAAAMPAWSFAVRLIGIFLDHHRIGGFNHFDRRIGHIGSDIGHAVDSVEMRVTAPGTHQRLAEDARPPR